MLTNIPSDARSLPGNMHMHKSVVGDPATSAPLTWELRDRDGEYGRPSTPFSKSKG
jgi:hypothetical protein